MAKVEMDLAELDQMRDYIKSLEKEIKNSNDLYIKNLSEKDNEIKDLKDKSKVIIKRPVLKQYHAPMNSKSFAKILSHELQENGRSIGFASDYYTLEYVIENIFRNKENYKDFSSKQKFESEQETFETLVNFEDIRYQVEQKFREEFKEDIDKYNEFIKTRDELEKFYQDKATEDIGMYNKWNQEKLDKLNQDIEKLKENHIKELSNLHESYKSDESKLDEVLDKMGYKLSKGLFGTKLIKK